MLRLAEALGVRDYRRHILVCVGPNCCSAMKGNETWAHLKTRLKQLERQGVLPPGLVLRTQTSCLAICRSGPILVIYPEGVWYRAVTPEVCERIILEHLGEGRVVEEHAFVTNPLS